MTSVTSRDEIEVYVNGAPRQIPAGSTVLSLLASLGVDTSRVAVERNRQVVPRAQHASTALAAGDRLEVLTIVGGGA